ncbi:conserved hypothetical protein [Klebsiella variicola]|nr:conserved hypothetical protein [Klebsiella variicola]
MSKRGTGREAEANVLAILSTIGRAVEVRFIYLCINQEILRNVSNTRVAPSARAEIILKSAYNNALCV